VADQPSAGQLRVTIGSPRSQASALASPAVNATCTVNRITVNRFSECEWVTVHVDVIKVVNGSPVIEGTADFDVKHQMTLKTNSASWSEKFTLSKATTTGQGKGISVNISAASGGGTKATVHFQQGHTLDSAASGTVDYKTGTIAPKKINPKSKTTYGYTFTKAGYSPGNGSYASAVYRCDNYYGSTRASRSGCAIPEAPTGVSMVGLARIDEGIRKLRSGGGHYGDPNGGKPLHWMINKTQEARTGPRCARVPLRRTCGAPAAPRVTSTRSLPPRRAALSFLPASERSPGSSSTRTRRRADVSPHGAARRTSWITTRST
jgi:hypothetical protein